MDIETEAVVGEHNGYWFHTIGALEGLGAFGWSMVCRQRYRGESPFVSRGIDPKHSMAIS